MTTYTNLGVYAKFQDALHRMKCEDCVLPTGTGCGYTWDISVAAAYVENSHYSYLRANCPQCGKVNKDPAP